MRGKPKNEGAAAVGLRTGIFPGQTITLSLYQINPWPQISITEAALRFPVKGSPGRSAAPEVQIGPAGETEAYPDSGDGKIIEPAFACRSPFKPQKTT